MAKQNMSQEPIMKKMQGGKPSMKLPLADDGKIHQGTGPRSNQSAAHFADAMTGFAADSAGPPEKQDSGR
jgi:hypothetical protein